MFLPESLKDIEATRFGVIIGPCGSGKTTIVRQLCSSYPGGVMCYEVCKPDTVVQYLSQEIGMKMSAKTVHSRLETT